MTFTYNNFQHANIYGLGVAISPYLFVLQRTSSLCWALTINRR